MPGLGEFCYPVDDLVTSVYVTGQPKAGKTTFVCHLVAQALRYGVGVLIPDLRGDYRQSAKRIPDALLVPFEQDRINPLFPPEGMSRRQWRHVLAARLTRDLGLQMAGNAYAINLLAKLDELAEQRNAQASLNDFLELLERQRPKPRSSEEGYRDRLLTRITALVDLYGHAAFNVQRGFRIVEALENGRLVILDLRVDKLIADFITSMHLYRLYFGRLHRPHSFSGRPVVTVLDEQRNLIRAQSHEFGVPDIELIFTRSRALRMGFIVAEQLTSAVSPALLQSCWLKLGFNSSANELAHVGRLLGLNREQAAELPRLPVGSSVARLSGDRIPDPFRLDIPYPDVLR